MKLLVVDNNAQIRRLLRRLLSDLSTDIVECADGREAIVAYRQHQPDWVLMDVELPGQDGLTATRQIKAQWPQANILIVTSFDEPALRHAAQAVGACGYVLKDNLVELPRWLAVSTVGETTTNLPQAVEGTTQ